MLPCKEAGIQYQAEGTARTKGGKGSVLQKTERGRGYSQRERAERQPGPLELGFCFLFK